MMKILFVSLYCIVLFIIHYSHLSRILIFYFNTLRVVFPLYLLSLLSSDLVYHSLLCIFQYICQFSMYSVIPPKCSSSQYTLAILSPNPKLYNLYLLKTLMSLLLLSFYIPFTCISKTFIHGITTKFCSIACQYPSDSQPLTPWLGSCSVPGKTRLLDCPC